MGENNANEWNIVKQKCRMIDLWRGGGGGFHLPRNLIRRRWSCLSKRTALTGFTAKKGCVVAARFDPSPNVLTPPKSWAAAVRKRCQILESEGYDLDRETSRLREQI